MAGKRLRQKGAPLEHIELYDILWELIGTQVSTDELFGERCMRLGRQVFGSCAAGSAMPLVYLEIPLLGEPRFDLQVCIDRKALAGELSVPESAPAAEQPLLEWLAGPGGADCVGMDLAFDLSEGDVTSPQLIALMRDGSFADAETFFALAGAPDTAALYRAAEARKPRAWRSWYTGVIARRSGSPVRLDFFVGKDKKRTYAQDTSLLARDLAQMGYDLSERELSWCRDLLAMPHSLNLQLDALSDGSMGPVLGYNFIEGSMGPQKTKTCIANGWMRQVFEQAETWGLADSRWQRLGELCQGRMIVLRRPEGGARQVLLRMKVVFIKIRMTPERLLDAKAYVSCYLRG